MNYIILIVILAYLSFADSKIYERCELVKELYEKHQLPQKEAGMFACIAEKHSLLDTSALAGDGDTSAQYHGLFQFSDEYWCSVAGEKKLCGGSCDTFRDDDITNDVYCAWYHVFVEHERASGDGFDAWDANTICQKQLSKYLDCLSGKPQIAATTITTTKRPSKITTKTTSRPKTTISRTKQDQSKIYSRCELAKELYNLFDVEWELLPTFVCIASQHSGFKSNEVTVSNFDGSTSNGIFQISDKQWCSNGAPGNLCNIDCELLQDDRLGDDVLCMKRILSTGKNLSEEWTSYTDCKEGDIWPYVEDCFSYDQSTERVVTQSVRTTKKPNTTKTTKRLTTTRRTTRTTKSPTTQSVFQNQRFQEVSKPPAVINEEISEPSRILLPPFEDDNEITTKKPVTTTTKRPQFPILKFFQQQFAPATPIPTVVLHGQPGQTFTFIQPDVSFTDLSSPDSSSHTFQSISPRASWSYDYEEIPSVTVSPFSVEYVKRLTIPPHRRFNSF